MFEKYIICSKCGEKYGLNSKVFRCEKCSGSLEIIFDYKKLRNFVNLKMIRSRPFNHLRYKEFYPVRTLISIQEGGTPLIRSKNIEKKYKLDFNLYFKYEALNPTGSFKDRGSSIEISKALELGAKRVICASTGNMGASVAAYSGVANIECSIFTPKDAKHVKIEQILAYGSKVYKVHGDYTKTESMVEQAFRKYGVYLVGDYPYRREGTKSVGFEIAEQLDFNLANTYIFTPVGNGTLISSLWKAMNEFYSLGFLKEKPKLVGIQAKGCNPVAKAFERGEEIKPLKNPKTLATAIECGNPLDGNRAVKSISKSSGFSESVSDREILKARELLAEEEGLFAEPAGAVSLAGLLKSRNRIKKGSKVVCLVTGHGLKTPRTGVSRKEKKIKGNFSILGKIFR
jgi:threonine synthase